MSAIFRSNNLSNLGGISSDTKTLLANWAVPAGNSFFLVDENAVTTYQAVGATGTRTPVVSVTYSKGVVTATT